MKTKINGDINKGRLIKSELITRPNATNGKYRSCQFDQLECENVLKIKDSDIFFLETLQMTADLADKMIAEAELQGKDTTDSSVMKELGEKINTKGKPIHRIESVMTAVFVSLKLITSYGIAIGIWSLVFKNHFVVLFLYGSITGFLISLLFVAPVIAGKRTKEGIKDTVFGVGLSFGSFGIIIGLVGILAWVIRLIFF
jgi:hypothetical protein